MPSLFLHHTNVHNNDYVPMYSVVCGSDVSATQKIGCFRVPKIIPRNGLFTQIEPISPKVLPY